MNARLPLAALLLALITVPAAAQADAVAERTTTVRVVRHQPAMRHTGTRIVHVVAVTTQTAEASHRRTAERQRHRARVRFRR